MILWAVTARIAVNTAFFTSRLGILGITDQHVTMDKDEGMVTEELEGFKAEALGCVRWRGVESDCLISRTSGIIIYYILLNIITYHYY